MIQGQLRRYLKSKPVIRNAARNLRIWSQRDLGWSKIDLQKYEETKSKILIATSFGGEIAMTSLESLIAGSLKVRGAEVHALLCDGISACQLCDTTRFLSDDAFIKNGFSSKVCGTCFSGGRNVYQAMGIKVHRFSDFYDENDLISVKNVIDQIDFSNIEIVKHYSRNGRALGEHVVAGACRYFAKADISDEPSYVEVLKKYFQAAFLVDIATSRLLNVEGFDAAVFNHGIYVPQGIISEACRANGVRVVNWNTAYRKKCFIFSHGETYHHELMSEPTEIWEDMFWDTEREEAIISYISSRSVGNNDWIKFNDRPQMDPDEVRSLLGISKDQTVIALYTNVMWDAQLHYPANVFSNMLEWILKTVEFFIARPNLTLVIRVHPAELTGHLRSRQLVSEKIYEQFPNLPNNIKIVGPDDKLNSYTLANICDSVIIYGTKTGVELSTMGIPVIVAGEAWLRGKNISIDASNQTEYFELLQKLPFNKRLDEGQILRARKYAYHFFFRRMIPLRSIVDTGGIPQYRLKVSCDKDLQPGFCKGLDVICDGILYGTEFVYDE